MPQVISSKTRQQYERPPAGPFVLNRDCPFAVGLQVYYPLGEPNPSAYQDYCTRRYNLILTGTFTTRFGPAGGLAATNDGTATNKLTTTTTPVTGLPLTIACWFNPVNVTAYYTLGGVVFNNTNEGYAVLGIAGTTAGDPVISESAQGGVNYANSATTTGYVSNTWQHAAGVFTSTTLRASYLNAGGLGTNTTSITASTFTELRVGGYSDVDGNFDSINGSIAEWGLWNIAKSRGDIWRMYDPRTRWEHRYRLGMKEYSFPQFTTAPPGPVGAFNAAWARANTFQGIGCRP